ncbi:MAG: hypothetical protein LBP33_10860 [Candidatus Adiutrix sp.]|jgi:predicted transcriptional regulator|nr:hypothetical protein [Candidatus Adiutrix sp.]
MSISISINPAIEEKLSYIANLTNTDIGTVLENLLSEGLEAKLDRLAAIQEGLDDIAAGRIVDHGEVISKARARIARIRAGRS